MNKVATRETILGDVKVYSEENENGPNLPVADSFLSKVFCVLSYYYLRIQLSRILRLPESSIHLKTCQQWGLPGS